METKKIRLMLIIEPIIASILHIVFWSIIYLFGFISVKEKSNHDDSKKYKTVSQEQKIIHRKS